MEMPEGWKLLKSLVREDVYPGEESLDDRIIKTAIELLKEFAEALETPGICTKITPDKKDCKACDVYKKFYNWK